MSTLSKKSPLHDVHTELGARFTDVAGWSMPLCYASGPAEHHAVRTTAGIFDLTHLGEIELSGPEAGRALDHALAGEPSKTAVGRTSSSTLVHETGAVLDDLLVHRLAGQRYLVVANAANTLIVLSSLRDRIDGYAATIRDASGDWALIAVPGPKSPEIVSELADVDVPLLRYDAIGPARLADHDVLLARTGRTGEDGLEIYCRPQDAVPLWRAVSAAGAEHGLVPCGLACRDTLRREAGLPLYGRELTVRTTLFDPGPGRPSTAAGPDHFRREQP